MNAATATLAGLYYDGRRPIGAPATLVFAGKGAVLIGAQISQRLATGELRVSPRIGRADRFIDLPRGGQFQCADHPLLDRLPQEVRTEGVVAWLEQRVAVAIASVAVILSLLSVGYFYGLPAAANYIAMRIPIETEDAVGRRSLAWLDENKWFGASQIAPDMQARIRQGFDELRDGLPLASHCRLEFRDSPFIGPNAFALPGGTIVITDAMVQTAESPEEVLAVLAHELGHVQRRHAMRHVLQDSAVAVAATAVTADAASLGVAVAGLPAVLARATYSRQFETEADDFAFQLLRSRGLSPEAFATLMERLTRKQQDAERALAFVSSHPVTAERIRRAREAAKR
ncbi:MAG: M48 family metallopeptidase [Bacteroidota bacterium]